MAESGQQRAGPSLGEILWRAVDRYRELPALTDADEFSAHIAQHFGSLLPEERFVDRFCSGIEKLHQPNDALAGSVVHATHESLHVYEFDLRRLDYVVVEDEEKVVVVSDFGQFVLERDDGLRRALEAAVLPERTETTAGARGWLVRKTGEMVSVDVKKVAATLQQFTVRQVSAPPVKKPAERLSPLHPVRRVLSEERELRILRESTPAIGRPAPSRSPERIATDDQAMLVLLPEGQVARASIGAASRWREMLGAVARESAGADEFPARRVAIQTGNAVAIVTRSGASVGERAELCAQALSAVRTSAAPVRVLGDDALTQVFRAGALASTPRAAQSAFWVQPEMALAAPAEASEVVASPVRLGEISGDPSVDRALTGGGGEVLRAARDRVREFQREASEPQRVAAKGAGRVKADANVVERSPASGETSRRSPIGAVVAYRTPDGRVVPALGGGEIRLASREQTPPAASPGSSSAAIAPRAGAVPASALATLQLALERTASAGRYKLPMLWLRADPEAIERGAWLPLRRGDVRRREGRLAAPPSSAGRVAQLLLSMPFPNRSEIHVGADLAQALHAVLAAPVAFAPVGAEPAAGATEIHTRPTKRWVAAHAAALHDAEEAATALEAAPRPRQAAADEGPEERRVRSAALTRVAATLPPLLRRALLDAGGWTPAPGALMPRAVRDVAIGGPFELAVAPLQRPLNAGEEEIVIPLPLWAEMGRGRIAELAVVSEQRTAAPPRPGEYRLVAESFVAAPDAATTIEVAGPASVELVAKDGIAVATAPQRRTSIGRIAIDDEPAASLRRQQASLAPDLPVTFAAPPATAAAKSGCFESGAEPPPGAALSVEIRRGSRSATRDVAPPRRQAPPAAAPRYATEPSVAAPALPRSAPTMLRFRYAGAPLWWSSSTQDLAGAPSAAERTVRGGLAGVNSAAALWRSILVAIPAGAPRDEGVPPSAPAPGGSTFAVAVDPIAPSHPVGDEATGAPAVIAIARSGRAGVVRGPAARPSPDAIEMSIVAAIPPRPPPLETMGAPAIPAREQPHARGRGHVAAPEGADGRVEPRGGAETVSQSRIEGSVDAIAQRIYHRIRRRMQSDRERFGG